jgi:hypothetical protein
MAKRCSHADNYKHRDKSGGWGLACYCGAVIPLGPSNDIPAEVQIEIRAAELARMASGDRDGFALATTSENYGWATHWSPTIGEPLDDGSWAGWLSRESCGLRSPGPFAKSWFE